MCWSQESGMSRVDWPVEDLAHFPAWLPDQTPENHSEKTRSHVCIPSTGGGKQPTEAELNKSQQSAHLPPHPSSE